MGHDQRVGTELIEEVAVHRHLVDSQNLGEQLGEHCLVGRGTRRGYSGHRTVP
jgi:hypothetical protein